MMPPGKTAKSVQKVADYLLKNPVGNMETNLAILAATLEARLLGHPKVIIVEFGVANGKGLLGICSITEFFNSQLGTSYEIYGFDRQGGMPKLEGYKDHCEQWHEGAYLNNLKKLADKLPHNCKLIIGDIRDTIKPFVENKLSKKVPLGFVSMDVDLYSSAIAALNIFNSDSSNYLPVVPMYFDDVYGCFIYNPWCGEQLAINEFNEAHEYRKIHHYGGNYKKIYMSQILDHPYRSEFNTEHPFCHFQYHVCRV